MLALWMGVVWAADWSETIDRVVGSVLVLKYERPRAFDGQSQGAPQASGFIVDAERGLILTNRHVVGTAPQIAHALFPNQEEIPIEPLYSDPIHDFGFYRYDPKLVELNQPVSLELHPEGARMGAEIRLIGNDAGEQISILDATISRIDRPAPWWDMNAFYVQAASDSSGGSSGSPVFDLNGHVVALNAGGRVKESTSYYLRLERVKSALEHLQRGEIPPRGSPMVEFGYRAYDELERRGLSDAAQARARKEWAGTGMLVVEHVSTGGPAQGNLQAGDILLEADGRTVYEFATLEGIWDRRVGQEVPVVVERGGERVEVSLSIQDLHAHTSNSFLTFAEGSFNELSYATTARLTRPDRGVTIAATGDLFRAASVPVGAVIEAIDGRPIDSLDTLQEVLTSMELGQVASVVYTKMAEPQVPIVARIRMVDTVFQNERCTKREATWTCVPVPHPTQRQVPAPAQVRLPEVQHRPARGIAKRLVSVSGTTLFPLDSMSATAWRSVGLVIDSGRGIVLTDRYAVPSNTTDVTLVAGDSGRIPAKVFYLDPLRNVAVITYDPTLLDFGSLDPVQWSTEPLDPEASYWAALIDDEGRPFSIDRSFSRYTELSMAAHSTPKYRADNLTSLVFGSIDRPTLGGAVVDKKGRIVSLYQNFRDEGDRGRATARLWSVPTWPARDALGGRVPLYAGIDLRRTSLGAAREAGVPDEALERLRSARPADPVVMEVWRSDRWGASEIMAGDFVLAVDGQVVTSFEDVQHATRAESVFTVIRDGVTLEATVKAEDLTADKRERAVLWAGALIQEEHPEVARESGTPPVGVYVSWYFAGTPAQRYGLYQNQRIVAVDNRPVEGLQGFLDAVKDLEQGEAVRLTLQSLQGRQSLITLRVDNVWSPTQVLTFDGETWTRQP